MIYVVYIYYTHTAANQQRLQVLSFYIRGTRLVICRVIRDVICKVKRTEMVFAWSFAGCFAGRFAPCE